MLVSPFHRDDVILDGHDVDLHCDRMRARRPQVDARRNRVLEGAVSSVDRARRASYLAIAGGDVRG